MQYFAVDMAASHQLPQRGVSAAEMALLDHEKAANTSVSDAESCMSESCDELKLAEKYENVGYVYANGKMTNIPFKRSCYLDRENYMLRIVRTKGEPKDSIDLGKVKSITRTERGFDLLGAQGKLYHIRSKEQGEHWFKEVRAVRLLAVRRDEVERQKDPYWRAKLAASERNKRAKGAAGGSWPGLVQGLFKLK